LRNYLFGLFLVSNIACPGIFLSPLEEDNTANFNDAVKSACSSLASRTINFSHGNFIFKSAPDPIPCAINIMGDGIGSTTLIRQYNGQTFLKWTRGIDHSGGSIKNLTILAGSGTNKGIAILIEAIADKTNKENSYNRHSFFIDNIIVGRESTTNTSWDFGLYLDGSKNLDGNVNSAPGIRAIFVDHSTFGGTNISNVYVNTGRGIDLHIECYTPLNGSKASVKMNKATQSVLLNSRNCELMG